MTLYSTLPTAEEANELPLELLALRLLGHLADGSGAIHGSRRTLGAHGLWHIEGVDHDLADNARYRIVEAYDWLTHRGLVAIRPSESHDDDRCYVTPRGREVAEREDDVLAEIAAADRLGVDLHPRIAGRIRSQYALGEHEAAAFLAMREVEIRVRELAEMPDKLGTDLMKQAFKEGGPLADADQDGGEREATMALFWGAIGVFKNPSSHREVNYDDPIVASEIVIFADLLLRMLDRMEPEVEKRKAKVESHAAIKRLKERIERGEVDIEPAVPEGPVGDTFGDAADTT